MNLCKGGLYLYLFFLGFWDAEPFLLLSVCGRFKSSDGRVLRVIVDGSSMVRWSNID